LTPPEPPVIETMRRGHDNQPHAYGIKTLKYFARLLAFAGIAAAFSSPQAFAGSKYGSWPGDDAPGTIVIITGDHTLHYIDAPGHRISYPIAVGKEGDKWFGETYVTGKRKNPDWRPTPDMRRKDPSLPAVVKGGPGNPLGVEAIYLAEGYLRIHGTNRPESIGHDASHGCFRMRDKDILELSQVVSAGARVLVLP
jgi:lipoprotein-anchoring transpeptidase ErfK/SrfK